MDLSFLTDLFGGGAIGGAIGAVAPLIANAQKRKQQAQDNEHDLEIQKLALQELEISQSHQLLVADKNLEIAESETEGEIANSELAIDLATVESQGKLSGAIAWVRPVLTGYLLIMLSIFTGWVLVEVGGFAEFGTDELVDIFRDLIKTFITLGSAAVLFWFTARQISK